MTLMIASFNSDYIYQEHTAPKNVWSRAYSPPIRAGRLEQAAGWQEALHMHAKTHTDVAFSTALVIYGVISLITEAL